MVSKKQYVFLVLPILVTFIMLFVQVHAQEPAQTGKGNVPTPTLYENAPQVSNDQLPLTRQNSSKKAVLGQALQNRIINLTRNASARMQAAENRLTNISTRLNTRIAKLKAAGVPTTDAEQALARANTSLASAHDTLVNAQSIVESDIAGQTPKESFGSAKVQFTAGIKSIHDARNFLQQTVMFLKNAVQTTGAPTRIENNTQATGTESLVN